MDVFRQNSYQDGAQKSETESPQTQRHKKGDDRRAPKAFHACGHPAKPMGDGGGFSKYQKKQIAKRDCPKCLRGAD